MSYPKNDDHPIKEWGKSMARQSEAKMADINQIMAKYEKTGVLPLNTKEGFFADVSTVGDYREAIERVEKADTYFMQVPAKIRKQFDNDPAKFLDFVSDPSNMEEIESMGLIGDSIGVVEPAPVLEEPVAAPEAPQAP